VSVAALTLGLLALAAPDAVEAAGKADDAKKYTEQLKTTKDAKKKAEALTELGKIAQLTKSLVQDAVPYIKDALKDKSDEVRAAAARAYGRTGPDPKEAVPLLVGMMKEEKNEAVKAGAVYGLAAMGTDAKEAYKDIRELNGEVRKLRDQKKPFNRELDAALREAMQATNPRAK
jgi:HEAT repeat protein